MSPSIEKAARTEHGFPRVSGDEPDSQIAEGACEKFSPRERG